MEEPEKDGDESALLNAIGFVCPLVLALIQLLMLESVNDSNGSNFLLLSAIFGLFWPLLVVAAFLTARDLTSSKLRKSAKYAFHGSIVAGLGFCAFAPNLISIS